MQEPELTPMQQAMVAAWERHCIAEFVEKSVDNTMQTMTAEPYVVNAAVMAGGVGQANVRAFYGRHFLPGNPDDTAATPVARTVGANRIVDELVHSFTHDIEMPWMLPGIPPTGKKVSVALVAVVEFEGDKVCGERIYWDQASVLAQIGLLDSATLPVVGAGAGQMVLNPSSVRLNELQDRAESKALNAA
jgi:carboxymethylenebutenolidase